MSHIEINLYLSLAAEASLDERIQRLLRHDPNRNSIKQDIHNNVSYAMSLGGEYVSLHVVPPEPSLEEQVGERIDNELLHQAILDLPPAQSRRILAYLFEGLSEREIAQKEGVVFKNLEAISSPFWSLPTPDFEEIFENRQNHPIAFLKNATISLFRNRFFKNNHEKSKRFRRLLFPKKCLFMVTPRRFERRTHCLKGKSG